MFEFDWRLWALKTGLFLGAFLALRLLNLPRSSRHLQRWVPLAAGAALIAFLVAAVVFEVLMGSVSDLYELVAEWTRPVLQAAWEYLGLHSITFMLFSIVCLWSFVAIKCILLGVALTIAGLRRLGNWVRSRIGKVDGGSRVSVLFPAYERNAANDVNLKSGWYYGRISARLAGLVLLVFLVIALTVHIPKDLAVLLQMLPIKIWLPSYVLLTVFLLETAWYLGGIDPEQADDKVSGADVDSRPGLPSDGLREHYLELWPRHWLVRSERRMEASPEREASQASFGIPNEASWVKNLAESQGTVIARFDSAVCQRDLFNAFTEKLARGGQILMLLDERHWHQVGVKEELAQWLRDGFAQIEGGATPWSWHIDLQSPENKEQIWVGTSQAVAGHLGGIKRNLNWYDGVSLVVFLDADGDNTLLSSRYALAGSLAGSLAERVVLVLGSDGRRIESAFRENLKLSTRVAKYTLPRSRPNVTAWVWRTDTMDGYETRLLEGHNWDAMGAEMSLAVPALADPGTPGVLHVQSHHVPLLDFRENLQAHLGRRAIWRVWKDRSGSDRSYAFTEDRLETLDHVALWSLSRECKDHVIIAHDELCNFPLLTERLASKSDEIFQIHVLARPYLLRNYFCAHIDYFLASPLVPLIPAVTDMRSTVVERIYHQMLSVGLSEDSLAGQLRDADKDFDRPEIGLFRLFKNEWNIDIFSERLLEYKQGRFRFDHRIKDHPELSWLLPCELIATDAGMQQNLGSVSREHIYQQFLPGQRFTFQGKLYGVEQISENTVQFEHKDPERPVYQYRNDLVLEYKGDGLKLVGNRTNVRRMNGLEFHHGLASVPELSVATRGYHEFHDARYERYVELGRIPERNYIDARATLVEFRGVDAENKARLSFTFATLLNELLPTLLPGWEKFCLVSPAHSFERNEADPVSLCIPEVKPNDFFARHVDSIAVVLVEDSRSDLGLTQAVYDEIDYILEIMHDYLCWVVDEDKTPPQGKRWRVNEKINESPFLCFGTTDWSEKLDLSGLKDLLAHWHGGHSGLTRRRAEFYPDSRISRDGDGLVSDSKGTARGDKAPLDVDDVRDMAVCDICGFRGERGGFDEISDGRLRCASCRRNAIDKFEDARSLYEKAVEFLEEQHGISVPMGGDIRLTDAKEIGEQRNQPFEPTPEFDGRAIGLAVRNSDGKWEVLVEMGMPDYMMSSVLVHELTHIWQFDNLDMDKAGLKLIEGHAVWSEVDFLESGRLVPQYVQRMKEREDAVYGEGYRELCSRMQKVDEKSAFRFMREQFARSRD